MVQKTGKFLLGFLCIAVGVSYLNKARIKYSNDVLLRRFLAASDRHDSSSTSDKPLILVMGLPRSGSISLHNFFQCNGAKSSHYCCGNSPKSSFSCGANHPTCGSCVLKNLQASKPAFDNCGHDYQVYSQFDVESSDPFEWFLPQHFALPLLHKDQENAIWILNRRDSPQVWADLHWYTVSLRIMNSFGMEYHRYSQKDGSLPLIGPQVDITHDEIVDCLKDAYDTAVSQEEHARRRTDLMTIYNLHMDRVRAFVRDNPSHKLIEIDVDDANAADVLVEAFDGFKPNCWNFEATDYDGDWKDFTLKV